MGMYHRRSSSTTGSFLSSSDASSPSSQHFSVRPDSPLVLPQGEGAPERRDTDLCRTPTPKARLLPPPLEHQRPSAMKKLSAVSCDSSTASASSPSSPVAEAEPRRSAKTVKFATESWSSFEALTDDEDTEDTEEEEEALEEDCEDATPAAARGSGGARAHRKNGEHHCREPSQSWDDETEAIVMEFLNLNSRIRARPLAGVPALNSR